MELMPETETDVVKRLSDTDNLLDIMIQLEDYLDGLDIYVFNHWITGEIVSGPWVKRHWVVLTLKYPYKDMPDPQGGLRLLKYGTRVEYEKMKEEVSVEVKTPDDLDPNTKKPKTKKVTIWLVHLKIPRRFIKELDTEDLTLYDEELDIDDVTDARDTGVDEESGLTDEGATPGADEELGGPGEGGEEGGLDLEL